MNQAAFAFNTLLTYGIGSGLLASHALKYGFKSNKEISDELPTVVKPSGWAFSIWGPIFALEAASLFYMDPNSRTDLSMQLAYVSQGVWTLVFGKGLVCLSTGIIGFISLCMFDVYAGTTEDATLPFVPVRLGFALHSSWLICATLVSCNMSLVASKKLNPEQLVTVGMASEIAATIVSLVIGFQYSDPVPALVAAWALAAIAMNEKNVDTKIHVGATEESLKRLSILGKALSVISLSASAFLFFF